MAGSFTPGNNQSYQTLLTNYQTSLLYTLPERCSILTQLLQDCPVKELQYLFPPLIEHVFGLRSGIDWGLLSLEKDMQAREFDTVRKFLAPDGPVLKLVYKFIDDSSPKFEFPISCLPVPSQLLLQEGKVAALYANKLQIVNPGLFPSSMQLNAYEFYFFHFAYYLANSSVRSSTSTVNQQDTLYAHLLEDYLCYFLPSDGRAVPLHQTPHIQHSPILTSTLSSNFGSPRGTPDTMYNRNCSRPDFLTPVRPKPSLWKKGTVMMVSSSSSPSTGFINSQTECWKSETLLLILKEMYLNQNSMDHQQNVPDLYVKTFVPSHYHVWMVRIFVKHLHFFFNSSLSSSNFSGHGQIMIDSLGRLKSLGMTQLIQKEMYNFLKSTFDHWPLDASFRVPLETWLSYIQPWRYTQTDLELSVWQKFMTENVLFYTSIFQQVLRRFLRMDFNCPKNAYMLYRVTRVYSMNDLREMIMQAERGCVSKPSNSSMSSSYIPRSPEKSYSLRKVSHLESPGTNYIPLFSEQVFLMVIQLLSAIAAAQEKAQYCGMNQSTISRSFFSKVCRFFDTSDDAYNSDDNSPSDIKKISSYLEASSEQLCNFFKEITPPVMNAVPAVNAETSGLSSFSKFVDKDNSKFRELSTVEKLQILNKRKKLPVEYLGNPDTQPVRTYEFASLVSFFNELSEQLNEKYVVEIYRLYYQPAIWGKVWRQVLAKPVTYYDIVKSKDMMSITRTPVNLPPRVHLRFLANKQLIGYFFGLLLVAYWFDYNPILVVLLLFLILLLSLFVSAIVHPVPIETKHN